MNPAGVDEGFSGALRARYTSSPEGNHDIPILRTKLPVALSDHGLRGGISLNRLLAGAWALVWSRYTASDEVLLETQVGQPSRVGTVRVRVDAAESLGLSMERIDRQFHEPGNQSLTEPLLLASDSAETGIFVAETARELAELDALAEKRGSKLRLLVRPSAGVVDWFHDPKTFRPQAVAALARCFQTLIENLPCSWETSVRDLRLLTPAEERRILFDWNQTQCPFPSEACIHGLFEDQVKRTPDAVAVAFRDQQWTYRELDAKANTLADGLRSAGVRPGELTAVAVNRSLELVAALLAALKAGSAYVPMDPAYPAERLKFMLEDAQPAAIIVSSQTGQKISQSTCAVVYVERPDLGLASSPAAEYTPSSNAAYVIYTSGSTGKPKGVVVTHRNVVNFFAAMDQIIGREPGVWLAVTSVSFDISVFELLWTLTRGFTVVIQEEGQLAATTGTGYSLPEQIRRYAVTHLQCTPSLGAMLVRDVDSLSALGKLRRLIVGGEALPLDLGRKLAGAVAGEVFNMYGPTETTIWSVACRVGRDDERIMIGRPIANTQVYVLDALERVAPAGFPGELYIGGEGVADGYLGRPDLTGQRFVANRFSKDGGRLYRTGDIVRYDSNGSLEFIGRADQQVKIRGFRVELGEIEAVLREHPQVRDAVVVVRNGPQENNDKRLAAYVIPSAPGAIGGAELRRWLRQKLPEVMTPATVQLMDHFPQTPNGKLDKNALPATEIEAEPQIDSPRNELERGIASIWADLLGVPSISLTCPFFDLGGHSLLMVEVYDQLRDKLGLELALVDLFRYPTVRSLTDYIGQQNQPESPTQGVGRGQVRRQAYQRRANT